MKFATYRYRNTESFGIVTLAGVVDLGVTWSTGPRSLRELIEAGPAGMDLARQRLSQQRGRLPLASLELLAPLPRPPKAMGLAVNYVEHHNELDRPDDMPDRPKWKITPRPFLMPNTAVAGPGATIPWPGFSEEVDHEVELAVVIGRRCKDVSPEQAGKRIFGYTVANDISARSCTHARGRTPRPKDDFFDWLHGKWSDGFFPIGPWIATADDVGDPRSLAIELEVDGEVRQQSDTSLMIFDVYETVSFCSHLMTLTPGDVIATGTPSGVGKATGKLLQPGQTVTARVENIGELANTIGSRPTEFYAPCENGA